MWCYECIIHKNNAVSCGVMASIWVVETVTLVCGRQLAT